MTSKTEMGMRESDEKKFAFECEFSFMLIIFSSQKQFTKKVILQKESVFKAVTYFTCFYFSKIIYQRSNFTKGVSFQSCNFLHMLRNGLGQISGINAACMNGRGKITNLVQIC